MFFGEIIREIFSFRLLFFSASFYFTYGDGLQAVVVVVIVVLWLVLRQWLVSLRERWAHIVGSFRCDIVAWIEEVVCVCMWRSL